MADENTPEGARAGAVRTGIIGWPIGHSLSPVIHAWWRKEHGLDGHYEHLPATDEAEFRRVVTQCREEGVAGVNITIPHKANAAAIADIRSDSVALLGVANMLSFTPQGLRADNSDIDGFALALAAAGTPGKSALILGAGGAAPAICLAVSQAGYEKIDIANRTAARAEALKQRFDFVTGTVEWEAVADAVASYDLIVNTTSLGMTGHPPLTFDFSASAKTQIVADIVYSPLETPLLAAAKASGLATVNGLAMLMHQAVTGFARWNGVTPVVTPAMEAHLVDRLSGRVAPAAIALTGSIGMGKSTVAAMFARLGAAIWNADDAVHALYAKGGAAVDPLAARFDGIVEDGSISREALSRHLLEHPEDFDALETIVHPLVAEHRARFLEEAQAHGALACVMDIPLLFEKNVPGPFDTVIAVTADEEVRRERVLARPGMTAEKYAALTARQLPEEDKIARADHVIRTDTSLEETFRAVRTVYRDILEKYAYPARP